MKPVAKYANYVSHANVHSTRTTDVHVGGPQSPVPPQQAEENPITKTSAKYANYVSHSIIHKTPALASTGKLCHPTMADHVPDPYRIPYPKLFDGK